MADGGRRLMGFDDQGVVIDDGDRILRSVKEGAAEVVRELVSRAPELVLEELGVVPTSILQNDPLVLEHEKFLVSYPHEWPAEMLRVACLFHLELFPRLQAKGLDLKDGLPQNVLFVGATPRFVDFLSIVRAADLESLEWLAGLRERGEEPRATVIRNMMVPYFIVPLVAMEGQSFDLARTMLREQACNVGPRPPSLAQVRRGTPPRGWMRLWRWRRMLAKLGSLPSEQFYSALGDEVGAMKFVGDSGYATYYEDKDEDFSFDDPTQWMPKQQAVARALEQHRPDTVLDLGCNTGWFSRLAARSGARVVAVDIDEASLNRLFLTVQRERSDVTPLRLAFQDLHVETTVKGPRHTGEVVFTAPADRLKSDLVLALGIVHHLTLGEGRSFASVVRTLADLSLDIVVLEFIDLDDPLVEGNPDYFPRLRQWTSGDYGLEQFIEAASDQFDVLTVEASHPASRSIVTLQRRRVG